MVQVIFCFLRLLTSRSALDFVPNAPNWSVQYSWDGSDLVTAGMFAVGVAVAVGIAAGADLGASAVLAGVLSATGGWTGLSVTESFFGAGSATGALAGSAGATVAVRLSL